MCHDETFALQKMQLRALLGASTMNAQILYHSYAHDTVALVY